ncbi:ferritin family protein, partial [Geminicoccus harenae]
CRVQREAAASYRRLAAAMRGRGDRQLEALFTSLAELKDGHVARIEQRSREMLGRLPATPVSVGSLWGGDADEEEAAGSASLTPYRALALAVRNEDRAFAFHTYVAAHAKDAPMQALAEEFATQSLDHGVALRRRRRQAFHLERPETPVLPETEQELRAIAAELDDQAAQLHGELALRLEERAEADAAGLFRRLAEEGRQATAGLATPAEPGPATIAEGIRILEHAFERYSDIAERAQQESVVREAQRLAEHSLRRLSLACQARDLAQSSSMA